MLASITRTREPSVLLTRAWEQNSSSISETSRTVIDDHPNVRAISPGQIRQAGTIFEFRDVALVVLFDLHGRSSLSTANAASGVGVPALFGNPEQKVSQSTITVRLAPEMVFEWPSVVTDLV
jgi:hypothetical protein